MRRNRADEAEQEEEKEEEEEEKEEAASGGRAKVTRVTAGIPKKHFSNRVSLHF